MCVLYVSVGSKVKPITFGCVAISSAVLLILRSRFILYSAGSGMNILQAILLLRECYSLYMQKLYVGIYILEHLFYGVN